MRAPAQPASMAPEIPSGIPGLPRVQPSSVRPTPPTSTFNRLPSSSKGSVSTASRAQSGDKWRFAKSLRFKENGVTTTITDQTPR